MKNNLVMTLGLACMLVFLFDLIYLLLVDVADSNLDNIQFVIVYWKQILVLPASLISSMLFIRKVD